VPLPAAERRTVATEVRELKNLETAAVH
jgi:hypothetical protein